MNDAKWRIEGPKRRITRKKVSEACGRFHGAKKGVWNLAREKILRERGALPKEEGDTVREYQAMHEDNFMSSWLREDGREKKGRWK